MNAPDLPYPVRGDAGPAFAEPWQAQAFALTLELHAQGAFTWAEWAETLAEVIKAAGPADDGSRYYQHWLEALERLATAKHLTEAAAMAERKAAWADAYRRTPHGKPITL